MRRCAISLSRHSVAALAAALVVSLAPPAAAATGPPSLVPPVSGPLTRAFDPPRHLGVDLGAPRGAPVTSPATGVVFFAGDVAGALWVTVLVDGAVLVTVGTLETIAVSRGDPIGAGALVGTVGSPGHDGEESGLHLSVRSNGLYVDPAPLLEFPAAVRAGRPRLIPETVGPPAAARTSDDALDDLIESAGDIGDSVLDAMSTGVPRATPEPAPVGLRDYVAFGDSLTTGFSVATCCVRPPPATPYPELVARSSGLSDLDHVGVWGATAKGAAQHYASRPQGAADSQIGGVNRARRLVTGALGINDMEFSNVLLWVSAYLTGLVEEQVAEHVAAMSSALDHVFAALGRAKERGARVVVTLYYNPYDSPACHMLASIGESVVSAVNRDLLRRGTAGGLGVADFRGRFAGHGVASSDPFVFGTSCDVAAAVRAYGSGWSPVSIIRDGTPHQSGKRNVAEVFDPHPNGAGTAAMAAAVMEVLG